MRKPRELKKGAYYHVYNRANRKEMIMNSKEIKNLFIEVLRRSKKKYKYRLINFVLMPNHFHMLIKPLGNEKLSRIMQWITSVFAQKFNKIFNYVGHVWCDRYKSKIIKSSKQFYRTFEYIAENPIRAGLVQKMEEYKYYGSNKKFLKIYELIDPIPT